MARNLHGQYTTSDPFAHIYLCCFFTIDVRARAFGPRDPKALARPALLAGVVVQGLLFLYARLRTGRATPLPGAVGLYLGSVLSAAAWVVLAVFGSD